MKVRIVLVEPQEGGNVGAVARVMKNFGFDDLVVVGTAPALTDERSRWWAAGAEDLLASIRHADSLEEAIADCHLSVATTAIRGRHVYEQLTPAAVAALASESLGTDERVAIVFGREKWGLTRGEMALCQRTASIATSPAYPTLNLAQSAGIFCYELANTAPPQSLPARTLAAADLTQALHRNTRDLLRELRFSADHSPERVCAELQALAGRAMLSRREASVLLAIVRQMRGRLESPEPPAPTTT